MKCAKCYDAVAGFLDDKEVRITSLESHNRELLAVIAAKDDLLRKVSVADYSGNYRYREDAKEILAIKPGDIALIEIGAVDHSSMIELMPGSASMVNFRDKVYVIQTKSNTEYRMI